MEHYITLDDLRRPPFKISESEMDSTLAEFLLDMTQEFIDSACKQTFTKEGADGAEVEKKVSGTGQGVIFLPKRLAVLKQVRTYGGSGYSEYTPDNFLYHPRYLQWSEFESSPSPRMRGDTFGVGIGNIGIVGIWGYVTVPTQIKYLQGRLISKIIKEGYMTEKNSSESVGDYSASPMMITSVVTGDSEIDTIIKRHTDMKINVPD
jgi:hypothetical protein